MSPIQDRPLIRKVIEMETHVGRGDWDAAAAFFTDEVMYHVAGHGVFRGIDGIRHYMTWQNERVVWTGHTPEMMMSQDGIVVIEVQSHFRRRSDGVDFTLPCTDIYRFEGERIRDWRVYADIAPFFGDARSPVPAGTEKA